MAEESKLTEVGWPRPVHNGWPVPWVSPKDELSVTDAQRLAEVMDQKLCQVCGKGHEPGTTVFICVNLSNEPELKDCDLTDSDNAAIPMDQGVMHERCARLAVGRCPVLGALKAMGHLQVISALIEDVHLGDLDNGDKCLGAQGPSLRRVYW